MKQMVSAISTIPYRQKLAVGESFKAQQHQQTAQAQPQISMAGVPGEGDHRKFLTAPFKNTVAIQTGTHVGTVGSIAYSTNKNQERDYDTGYFGGLYAPTGDYGPPVSAVVMYDPGGPPPFFIRQPDTLNPVGRIIGAPSRTVITTPSKAGVFNIKVIGETDVY